MKCDSKYLQLKSALFLFSLLYLVSLSTCQRREAWGRTGGRQEDIARASSGNNGGSKVNKRQAKERIQRWCTRRHSGRPMDYCLDQLVDFCAQYRNGGQHALCEAREVFIADSPGADQAKGGNGRKDMQNDKNNSNPGKVKKVSRSKLQALKDALNSKIAKSRPQLSQSRPNFMFSFDETPGTINLHDETGGGKPLTSLDLAPGGFIGNQIFSPVPGVSGKPPFTRNPNARRQITENGINDPDLYFDGDVELSEVQADAMLDELQAATNGKRRKRKIGREPTYSLWSNLPISYEINPSVPRNTKSVIKEAIKLWEDNTCVRFEENGQNKDRIEFYDGGGCSSYVGRTGGLQQISIATPGCNYVGIVSHEIGHSLGFFHEQARPDQARNVEVKWSNVNFARWNNFLPKRINEVNDYSLPYDYGSVMHYDGYGFAVNPNNPSIETLDPNYQDTIGQRIRPSFIDFSQVNSAYCSSTCGGSNNYCQNSGYPHPNNCNECICPSGFGGTYCDKVQPSSCGSELIAYRDPEFLTTPNYPSNFPKNKDCNWLIKTEPGYRVYLEFVEEFDYDCKDTCDESYVEVKKGSDFRKTGYRFCCSKRPSQQIASGDEKLAVMHNSNGNTTKGFKLKYWTDAPVSKVAPTTTTTTPRPTTTPTTQTTTTRRTTTEVPWWLTTTTTRRPRTTETTTQRIPWWLTTTTTAPPATTPPPPSGPTTTAPKASEVTNRPGCNCGQWGEWNGQCDQECGGCGTVSRSRTCNQRDCYDSERKKCNFEPCVGKNFLFGNGKFNIIWNGCCIDAPKDRRTGLCGGRKNFWGELFSDLFPSLDPIRVTPDDGRTGDGSSRTSEQPRGGGDNNAAVGRVAGKFLGSLLNGGREGGSANNGGDFLGNLFGAIGGATQPNRQRERRPTNEEGLTDTEKFERRWGRRRTDGFGQGSNQSRGNREGGQETNQQREEQSTWRRRRDGGEETNRRFREGGGAVRRWWSFFP